MMQRSAAAPSARSVRAWDWPTRAFHWALVLSLLSAWVSFKYAGVLGDTFLKWHRYNGYFILILLVFRVLWGFAGGSTSRLSAFITWPWRALGYGMDMVRGRERHFLGHNPLGTWMIIAVFSVVFAQAFIGLFIVEHNDLTWGPLYKLASEATQKVLLSWHLWAFYWIVLPLVAIHVSANILYQLVKKDPLVTAMVTGRKPAGAYEDQAEAVIPDNVGLRAVLCFAFAAVIVLGGIVAAGGRLFY
jgi:cytochrome b